MFKTNVLLCTFKTNAEWYKQYMKLCKWTRLEAITSWVKAEERKIIEFWRLIIVCVVGGSFDLGQ